MFLFSHMSWNEKLQQARELRQRQTRAEKIAWQALRNRNLQGYKFRRQHIIGGFIADFYCPQLKLIIELDGKIHDSDMARSNDLRREIVLKKYGLDILRIKNQHIIDNADSIRLFLARTIQQTLSLEEGEGGPPVGGPGEG